MMFLTFTITVACFSGSSDLGNICACRAAVDGPSLAGARFTGLLLVSWKLSCLCNHPILSDVIVVLVILTYRSFAGTWSAVRGKACTRRSS